MRWLMLAAAACGSTSAAPMVDRAPSIEIAPITDLCVTRGERGRFGDSNDIVAGS